LIEQNQGKSYKITTQCSKHMRKPGVETQLKAAFLNPWPF